MLIPLTVREFSSEMSGSPYLFWEIACARLEEIGGKLEKKLDVWQGNSLSIGGRSVLIKSSRSSITIYHMSMFLLPKTTIKGMDTTSESQIGDTDLRHAHRISYRIW
jgi:hypothetical protein